MDLFELLRRQAAGETLTQEELDYISMYQDELNDPQNNTPIAGMEATNPFGAGVNTVDSNPLQIQRGVPNSAQNIPAAYYTPAYPQTMQPGIGQSPIPPQVPASQADKNPLNIQRVEPRPAGNISLKDYKPSDSTIQSSQAETTIKKDNQDIPQEYLKNYRLTDDQLSQAALYSNILGAGVSFDTALFSLGQSLGTDNKGTANTMRGVGAAGKLVTGGARQLLSGVAYERRNNYVDDYNEKVKRDQMIGDYLETEKYGFNPGGALFEKGGTKEGLYKDLGKYLNKRKYEDGEEVQGDNMQQSVAPTQQDNYAVGDTITFRDKSGKLITGKIASIKNGEIEII